MSDIYDDCFNASTYATTWEAENCEFEMYNYINDNNNVFSYNSQKMLETQRNMQRLFNTYLSQYEFTDNVTSPRFDPFQFTLAETCASQEIPGVCDLALKDLCSKYTRDEVSDSRILTNLCGCYVAPDPVTMGNTRNAACDVICNRASTARKINLDDGKPVTCEKNICAITDIIFNDVNSTVQGGINFNSLCSNCTGNKCRCIISGINISTLLSNIGVTDITFGQFCDNESVCAITDQANNVVNTGACAELIKGQTAEIPTFSSLPNFLLIFLLISVVVIVAIVLLMTRRVTYKIEKQTKDYQYDFDKAPAPDATNMRISGNSSTFIVPTNSIV